MQPPGGAKKGAPVGVPMLIARTAPSGTTDLEDADAVGDGETLGDWVGDAGGDGLG